MNNIQNYGMTNYQTNFQARGDKKVIKQVSKSISDNLNNVAEKNNWNIIDGKGEFFGLNTLFSRINIWKKDGKCVNGDILVIQPSKLTNEILAKHNLSVPRDSFMLNVYAPDMKTEKYTEIFYNSELFPACEQGKYNVLTIS